MIELLVPGILSVTQRVPQPAQSFIDQIAASLPHVKITELLLEVDQWTGFTKHFTHLESGDAAKDWTPLLTTILADAINLGLTKMAESCPGLSYTQLSRLQAWHIRDETLRHGPRRTCKRSVAATIRRALERWHDIVLRWTALQGWRKS